MLLRREREGETKRVSERRLSERERVRDGGVKRVGMRGRWRESKKCFD